MVSRGDVLGQVIVRPLQSADIGSALGAIRAAARADDDSTLSSVIDLHALLDRPPTIPGINPADDLWVAVVPESGVVAFAEGRLTGSGDSLLYRTQCSVRPEHRRRGIGAALLARQLGRARYIARHLAAAARPVSLNFGARALESQVDAQALFTAHGLQHVRYFVEFERDLSLPLPALDVPPEVTLRRWDEQPADRSVWQAVNEAFADHWGYVGEPFEAFVRRMETGRFQRENSFIAWAGEAVAGACLNDMGPAAEARLGAGRGWVGSLSVRRPWRRTGLGRALLIASLRHAQSLGHRAVGLNADAENLTGAVRLYESVGFKPARRRLIFVTAIA